MEVFNCVVILALLIDVIQCEEHLYAHGPFGKAHLAVKIPSLFNCNRSSGLLSRSIRSKSLAITEVNVSVTKYSNMGKIVVPWKASTAPCKDGFMGVHFVEVRVSTDEK